jgi:alkanesulfonate monooxygenase SsuD/methylene tetrahydromethanopterin reductase-like flavin-dependent oxidoreductase (luciferase family)
LLSAFGVTIGYALWSQCLHAGEYADPRLVVDLAGAAEEAGWESLFVWDHLGFTWGVPSGDPWVTLAGVAQATSRLQRPRVPIWIGGDSAPAKRRAVRWDGWIVGGDSPDGTMMISPDEIAAAIDGLGPRSNHFEIALSGVSASDDHTLLQHYADAGVTWWLESIHGQRGSMSEMLDRIGAGPAMPH